MEAANKGVKDQRFTEDRTKDLTSPKARRTERGVWQVVVNERRGNMNKCMYAPCTHKLVEFFKLASNLNVEIAGATEPCEEKNRVRNGGSHLLFIFCY